MYNPDNRQYLFRDSTGRIFNLYHEEKRGLCFSSLTKKNYWSDPVILSKDCMKPISADMDQDDTAHIFFQDKHGNLLYNRVPDPFQQSVPVLNSKSQSAYNKHINVISMKNVLHLFYVLQHNEERLLAHQTFSDGKPGTPRVVDYVTDTPIPYAVCCDKSGSIFAFYQSSDGKHYQLGYKRLAPTQKSWSEFIPVTNRPGDAELPVILSDNTSIIHMCYQYRSSRQYELIYRQKVPDKNMWSNESVIHSSSYPFDTASILYTSAGLYIFWVRDDTIFYSASTDKGSTWSKAAKYNFSAARQLVCLAYKSNHPSEYEKIITRHIPGSFINGVKFAFYQIPPDNISMSADELKNMIVDSLKMLNASVDELKEADGEIRDSLSKLELSQQSMEKEQVKCSLKLSLMEEELLRLKQMNMRMESLTATLRDMTQAIKSLQEEMQDIKTQTTENPKEEEMVLSPPE